MHERGGDGQGGSGVTTDDGSLPNWTELIAVVDVDDTRGWHLAPMDVTVLGISWVRAFLHCRSGVINS